MSTVTDCGQKRPFRRRLAFNPKFNFCNKYFFGLIKLYCSTLHWCNDNRHCCSGVLHWCSEFLCGDRWWDRTRKGSWIASKGSLVLGCVPAVLLLLGLAMVLPEGKKSSWWRKTQNKDAWVTKTKVERDTNKTTGGEVQEGSTTMISNRR